MLIRQLEYFVAVSRERHFARAAATCHVSQPALSEGLQKLEAELGVPLIRRGHTFEGLTPEGERIVVWARRILAQNDALLAEAEALRGGLGGTLRIGAIPSASTTVAQVLEPFCNRHPLVNISIVSKLSTAEVVRRIGAFELDAGICYPPDSNDDLSQVRLYQERWTLLASESLLGNAPESMTWAEAATHPLAVLDSSLHGRAVMDRGFADAGTEPHVNIETDSVASLFALVHTGNWASIVPDRWAMASGSTTDLVFVALTEPELVAPVVLVFRKALPLSPLVRALAETVGARRTG